ncbi:hypothetical protein AB0J86_26730 [Micromonospora sp. NPDC049559]|uniref:coiled-coil domain-containing protein n=1 Tax=Micromonospora sp. NPDC049559 TaxID=3155923 RepID=UPI00344A7B89
MVFVGTPAAPATAAPKPAPGDEGGTKSLRDALEAAARGHLEAKAKLEASQKRQGELTAELQRLEARLTVLSAEVGVVAAESYRVGRLSAMSMLLNSGSPESFLDRVAGLDLMAQRDSRRLGTLLATREQATRAKAAIDNEVKEQGRQLAVLAKRKQDAERALATVGGGAAGGFISANSPLAKPAPRNSDGSWPKESCTIDDPTTDGCITPRTLHAYNEARAAGFKRYTACKRSGGDGEHPKGRACDFSAAAGGFEDKSATGGDRTYGNNLAAFLVKNASRLGVMYVIWYRQIWMPSTGWRAYSGAGSPAADHTNHVHLSML